jgi:hypothetical protein
VHWTQNHNSVWLKLCADSAVASSCGAADAAVFPKQSDAHCNADSVSEAINCGSERVGASVKPIIAPQSY